MRTIAFFNNKGGVGKTSLVYHLAWMFADHGIKTLAVDLDPQANLTSMFLNEERLEELWPDGEHPDTVYGAIRPVMYGAGDVAVPKTIWIADNLELLPGDVELSGFEDKLSENWLRCLLGERDAYLVTTAFCRMIQLAAEGSGCEVVLVDMGPNLGAINRSAIISAEQVIVPLMPDLFSLRGLYALGATLKEWRDGWERRLDVMSEGGALIVPAGKMKPSGYVIMRHGGILPGRMLGVYQRWMDKIPQAYHEAVLGESVTGNISAPENDPYALALLKHYRSLMPMAMEAHKPIFLLKSADGAIGSHQEAVASCYADFKKLAGKIAANAGISFS